MAWWQLIIYAAAGFIMAILSGIAGAGGGFVMTPLAIILGLTPAQAVSTGKLNGLAVTVGSLSGLRGHGAKLNKRRIIAIMVLAFIVGLMVPFVIKSLDSRVYRLILGVILLLMIPVMIYKKVGITPHKPGRVQQVLGGGLLTVSLFLQGAFSGGLGSLVNIVLMGMLGMTANEAHVTKRWSQIILNITVIFGVIGSHLIVWSVVLAAVTTNILGSHIGGRLAVKHGDQLAINVMLGLMVVSSATLIIGAL